MIDVKNFVGGKFVNSLAGETIENIAPATGTIFSTIPRSKAEDVNLAVDAALAAQNDWAALSRKERSEWLEKIADALELRREDIALMESKDTGKPIRIARTVDANRSVSNFRFFAKMLLERSKENYDMDNATNYVVDRPIGVVGLITPWNLPLYLLSWKIAPAIAMGNTVVAKPSEITPMTANLLAEILDEISFPPGVINIVHGYGYECGDTIVTHDRVGAISFTGGTETGGIVASKAAPKFKKISLELGGKNATIVLDDVDLDAIVPEIVRSSFLNQGQICLCGSRIFVSESIRDDFTKKFVAEVEKMHIGKPSDESTEFGSLVSFEHREKVESYIELAKQEGGKILTGGERPSFDTELSSGAFLLPTVVDGLAHTSQCATEEIFGPVVTLHGFSRDDEVIEYANSTKYGLAGSVWTKDIERGKTIAEAIDTGMIWINCWLQRDLRVPFGGTKNSGLGREGGQRSLAFFSKAMNICIRKD